MKKDGTSSWDWDGEQWWEQQGLGIRILVVAGLIALGVGLVALYGWLVMSLWNWLVPDLFGVGRLDFWKALGLPFLIMLLFLGVGGGDKSASGDRKRKKRLKKYLQAETSADDSGPGAVL